MERKKHIQKIIAKFYNSIGSIYYYKIQLSPIYVNENRIVCLDLGLEGYRTYFHIVTFEVDACVYYTQAIKIG